MNKLIIIGASGHGKVIADIARLNGYDEIVFLDDNPKIKECFGYPVIGGAEMVDNIIGDVFVAVGDSGIRKALMEKFSNRNFPILIHPYSAIAEKTVIDIGTVVMAGAVINPEVIIGKGCIINTSCSIDHDCYIGDFCHVSVGAHLCGTVKLENNIWVGAGSVISNNLNIKSNVYLGAGTVVIKDIDECGVYIGVPAKKINNKGTL